MTDELTPSDDDARPATHGGATAEEHAESAAHTGEAAKQPPAGVEPWGVPEPDEDALPDSERP